MSYPNIIYLKDGQEKVAQSTKIGSLRLGQLGMGPDGSKYRHAVAASGTAMTAGYLYGTPAVVADTAVAKSLACTAAVGATSVIVTNGGTTAITADYYADGYLCVASSTGTGTGRRYTIKTNNSSATGSTCTIGLYESIETAIGGTTATVGLRANKYKGLLVTPGDTTVTGPTAGIPPVDVPAGYYCWLQTGGPAMAFVAGTVNVVGEPVVASTGVAGAVAAPSGTASTKQLNFVGEGMTIPLTNGFALVNLTLDR